MNLGELITNTCHKFSSKPAIREDDYAITFKQLDLKTNRLANAFNELGIQKGERIALYTKNCHQYLEYRMAFEKAGIVYVPINRLLSSNEVLFILQNAGARGVICDQDSILTVEPIRDQLSDLEWILTVDKKDEIYDEKRKVISYRYMLDHSSDKPIEVSCQLQDLCSINYTSGSTGDPKGVMLSQRNWLEVYKNMLMDRDIGAGGRLLHIGPLTHASGSYFMPFFLRGSENIISSKKDVVDSFFDYVEKYSVSAITCVPTMLIRIMDDPRIHTIDKSSLEMIGYGAAPMPKEQIKRALELFGPILVQNYGQTEAYMTVSYLSIGDHIEALDKHEERLTSIGRPYTFVNVDIMDENGRFVNNNKVGELVIKSEHVMQGYWGLPEETKKTFKNGWLLTGDIAKRDVDGFIYLLGRKKEMIISGGFNIYPREVEEVLNMLPYIRGSVVIGVESEEWGEKIVAFLETKEEYLSEIKNHCKEKLGFKKPKEYILLNSLPKNATGKIDKNKLRKIYHNRKEIKIG